MLCLPLPSPSFRELFFGSREVDHRMTLLSIHVDQTHPGEREGGGRERERESEREEAKKKE